MQRPITLIAPSNANFFATANTTVSAIIFLLVIVAVREKINIAVAILKEASKALADMPFMVLFPGVTTIGVTVFFVVWAYLFALVYTAGGNMDFSFLGVSTNGTSVNATNSSTSLNIGNATLTISFTASSFKDYMCIFDFFMLLWINNFIQGIGIMTICGAVVKWYWTKSPKGENMEGNPVLSAYMRTWYFHSGSVAFGAFLIAVVQFIRAVLAYIDSQTKELQESNFMMKVRHSIWFCWRPSSSVDVTSSSCMTHMTCACSFLLRVLETYPSTPGHHEMRSVPPLVLRKMHEVHHQERLHHCTDEGQEFLLCRV